MTQQLNFNSVYVNIGQNATMQNKGPFGKINYKRCDKGYRVVQRLQVNVYRAAG